LTDNRGHIQNQIWRPNRRPHELLQAPRLLLLQPAPAEGETCCNDHKASELQTYAKDRIAALGLKGKGSVRINKAGCLGRCDDGPVLVVYPDNVWYTYVDKEDIDEIIDSSTCRTAAWSSA
jgi:(2Fe-2S) ferredoxin